MVKKFNEMLENYAEKVNFPYDPVGSEDTILIFSRHFRFCTEPFDNLIFGHRINILNIDKENPCASVFLEISVSEKPEVKLVSEINKVMRSVYSLTVEYDDELKCLLVSYVQRLNDLTIEKMIDNGIDDLFIRRIYYFARLVLQTYVNAVNNDTDADTALFEAEEEICETDIENDVEFIYESVKDIAENNGERYFIERELLLGSYFSDPEKFVKMCSKKKGRLFNEYIDDIRDKLDLRLSYGEGGYQEYKIRVKKKEKFVHLFLPEAVRSGDCTDMFLFSRSGSTMLATVEFSRASADDRKRYIVCVRSNDGSCMIAGVFRKHGRAVDFMKERLSAA